MRKLLEREFFPFVIKPGRYAGGEQGQITKEHTNSTLAVLAVPDLYDFRATDSFLQRVYFSLNSVDHIVCERAFLPDHDAVALLREKKLPLFSLESSAPVKNAKLIVFIVDDPLYFPNCITLLELAKIPTKAADRNETHPLVIAIAPTHSNPTPLASIFDGFLIGEAATPPLLNAITQAASKQNLLSQLETAVPAFTSTAKLRTVTAGQIAECNRQTYPASFIAPLIATANARIEIELNGTNPDNSLLIRKPSDLAEYIESGLRATGFDEIYIQKISVAYPELEKQIISVVRAIENKQIQLSIESLPPETFTPHLIDALKKVTDDPPAINAVAGNERLRSAMGCTATDSHILNAAHLLFERGYTECHLSFMIGCPTEEDSDIISITALIKQIQEIGKSVTPRSIVIHISAFTPSPHTPWQWDAIPDPTVLHHKLSILQKQLRQPRIVIKHKDFEKATLRSALTRLHTNTENLLQTVAGKTAASDADLPSCWKEALPELHISEQELRKAIPFSTQLPWTWIHTHVSDDELRSRRQTVSTLAAPIAFAPIQEIKQAPSAPAMEFGRSKKIVVSRNTAAPTKNHVRLRWGKDERGRFMSHLDNVRLLERILCQAQIPVAFSNAKRPTMKLSHCHPLPLGFTSEYELVEITLNTSWMSHMIESLKRALPLGFTLYDARITFGHTQSLSAVINRVVYTLSLDTVTETGQCQKQIEAITTAQELIVQREGKSGITTVDIKPAIFDLQMINNTLIMTLGLGEKGYARPTEVLTLLRITGAAPPFHRKELFTVDDTGNKIDGMQV